MHRFKLTLLTLATAAAITLPLGAQTQSCPRIEVDCLHARPRVLPGVHFSYGATAQGDAWVARHDVDRGNEPTWRVTLGGPGIETVAAIALRQAPELLVVGASTSAKIPGISGQNSGGMDGVLYRLDLETGSLLGGRFVGTPRQDELTGVAENPAGEIFVVGQSDALPGVIGRAPKTMTRVLPASTAPTAKTRPAFLSGLGVAAQNEVLRYPLGYLPVKYPRVWVDCWGNLVVGVSFAVAAPCFGSWPDLVYEQDSIAEDYSMDLDWGNPLLGYPPGGFGFHALRWKEYHANITASPPFVLDWALVTSPAVPKDWNPGCPDANDLNTLETQVFLQSGIPTDPGGSWQCGNHADVAQLSLYSAFLHTRWGTPVYTHFGSWSSLSGPWVWSTFPAAIERTVFEPYCMSDPWAYSGQTLEDLCDLSVNTVGELTCTTSSAVPGVAGTGYFLKLKHFEGANWAQPLTWANRPVIWNPDTTYFWQEWYEPGVYLMDPPEGSENEVAILETASKQLSGLVSREGRVTLSRVDNGVVTCEQQATGMLPANE